MEDGGVQLAPGQRLRRHEEAGAGAHVPAAALHHLAEWQLEQGESQRHHAGRNSGGCLMTRFPPGSVFRRFYYL